METTVSENIIARELKPSERDSIVRFVMDAPRFHTLPMRPAAKNFDEFEGWWYGAVDAGTSHVRAIMCIQNSRASMYSGSDIATDVMAKTLLKQQQILHAYQTKRHILFGYKATVDKFWRVFRMIDRQVVQNAPRDLLRSEGKSLDKPPSKRVKTRLATAADQKLVSEFLAEYMVENEGHDPRRMGRSAHDRRVSDLIGEERLVVAREGDRPVFICELRELEPGSILLDNIYVPLPFRQRKRLIAGALYDAQELGIAAGKEVLFFGSDAISAAGERAGYEQKLVYQQIAMLG